MFLGSRAAAARRFRGVVADPAAAVFAHVRAAAARRFRGTMSNPVITSEIVPRITVLLGGAGLAPFFWYGSQIQKSDRVWGDDLLRGWEAKFREWGLPDAAAQAVSAIRVESQQTVRLAFVGYSAAILSFLGGVHWGGAALHPSSGSLPSRYSVSVVPSLLGWGAALYAARPATAAERQRASSSKNPDATARELVDGRTRSGISALALSFLGVYLADEWSSSKGHLPRWYTKVRTPLTFFVVLTHVAAGWQLREPPAGRAWK
jgi:hypothetical protein